MGPSGDNTQYFRESTRAPLRAPITLQIDTFKDPEPGFTGNISLGGMFVEIEDPLPVGTIVKFELHFDPPLGGVRGTAEVTWIRPHEVSKEKPAGIGLQFRHLEDEGEIIVRGAVEEVLQAQGLSVEPPTVESPKPRPKPKRSRVAARASRDVARDTKHSESEQSSRQQAPEKVSGKGSKKEKSGSDQRVKLIAAIILIVCLIIILSRTFG